MTRRRQRERPGPAEATASGPAAAPRTPAATPVLRSPLFALLAATLIAGGLPLHPVVFSQEPPPRAGAVGGTVFDASTFEPLASANVTVSGTRLGAVTDGSGKFAIEGVPAGEYTLRVSLIGYRTVTRADVVVTPVRPAEIRIGLVEAALELEGVSAEAEVFATSPEFPVSVSRQSSEEIRRLPGGFEDVLRAVSILPGVAQAEPGRNDLIVRGGAPSENLYLLDGIEVPNINHFGTQGSGGGPLSFVNIDFVGSTTFSTGGFGPKYGDRLSSVLTIGLRDGREDRVGGKLTLSATQFGLNLEGPASGAGTFLFSARRSYLDLIFRGAGFGFVPEYWDFLGKWRYAPSPADEIRVVAISAIDDVRFFNDTAEKRYDNSKILGNSQRQISGGVHWRRLIPSGYVSAALGQAWTQFSFVQRDTTQRELFANRSLEHVSSIRTDLLVELGKSSTLGAGLEARLARFRHEVSLPAFVTPYGDTLRADLDSDTTGVKAALYAQYSIRSGRFSVNAGVRQSYFTLTAGTPPPEPRVSVSFELDGSTTLDASAGRYAQSPAYVWLSANAGDNTLRHIVADQLVLGIRRALRPDTRLSVEGYLKRYRRYPVSERQRFLVLSNTGAGFGGSEESFASFGLEPLVSAGTGFSRGVEVSVRKQLSDLPWYGLFSLSLGETRYTALDGVERPSAFDQRIILNAGGGVLLGPHWEVSAKFRFAGGRPYTPFNPDGTKSADRYHAARLPANHSLDLRVDRRWFFDSWALVAYIDVQNVYNRTPSGLPTYDARTGKVEEDDSIGLLPSIGISGEF